MKEKICRLCLSSINNDSCQTIEESLLKTLKLNPNVCKETVMCIQCADWLQVFSNFMPARIPVGDGTLPSSDFQNNTELQPVEIDATSNLKSRVKTEIKCSFCKELHGREDLISLYESKENMFLVEMLEQYTLETNLKTTEELLTCGTCLEALQGVSSSISKCLEVEEKISKYIELEGADDNGQIDLKDVQQFMFKPIFKSEIESFECDQIQEEEVIITAEAEIKYEDVVNNTELTTSTGDGQIKTEQPDYYITDIKSEQSDGDGFQELLVEHKIPNDPLHIPMDTSEMRKRKERIKPHPPTPKSPSTIKMFKCELCSFETKYRSNLKNHLLTHKSCSEINMFKCNICLFETKRKFGLKSHLLTHENSNLPEIKMFKCALCSFESKYKSCLKYHLLTHKNPSEIEMFKCDLCSYEAKRKSYLKDHLLTHESPEAINMIKCELCPYKAKKRSCFNRHLLTHKNPPEVEMFKCEMCLYQATRKSHLQTHLSTHVNPAKLFKCDLCSFMTKQQWYFKKHLLTHKNPSEVTMLKCELCPYKATRPSFLKWHLLTHKSPSEIEMFKCEMCPYQAKRKSHLQMHLLTHTNPVKLFKCDMCSFNTKQEWYFKKHLLTHKSLVDIKTENCDATEIGTLHK